MFYWKSRWRLIRYPVQSSPTFVPRTLSQVYDMLSSYVVFSLAEWLCLYFFVATLEPSPGNVYVNVDSSCSVFSGRRIYIMVIFDFGYVFGYAFLCKGVMLSVFLRVAKLACVLRSPSRVFFCNNASLMWRLLRPRAGSAGIQHRRTPPKMRRCCLVFRYWFLIFIMGQMKLAGFPWDKWSWPVFPGTNDSCHIHGRFLSPTAWITYQEQLAVSIIQ